MTDSTTTMSLKYHCRYNQQNGLTDMLISITRQQYTNSVVTLEIDLAQVKLE